MKYIPTIGIECHVQLKTESKLFTAVNNDARGVEPNQLTSPLCFGLPGTLPVLNEAAVELGIRAGLALNAEIAKQMKFDRKHYFYPDLPKGYQITQFDQPIVGEGFVEFELNDETVKVGIERAHLEEDAGKSTHPTGETYSLVDLNRAGTPLLEIVSKPDMHSAKQARGYAQKLYDLMKYAGVSEVDLYHGNMRFDVNISLAPEGSDELGIRAEVKNLNSFKSVERASEYEIKRQTKRLDRGEEVVQETRGWDDSKQKTTSQRSKEDAHDYRYFPEPDIPPVAISDQQVESIKDDMPVMPDQIRSALASKNISSSDVNSLIANQDQALQVYRISQQVEDDTLIAIVNLVVNTAEATKTDSTAERLVKEVPDKIMIELAQLYLADEISSNIMVAKYSQFQMDMYDAVSDQNFNLKKYLKENNLLQISDDDTVEAIVDQVIADNPDAADDVRGGEQKAIGYLVGQVMQQSKGQANPKQAKDLLQQKLG